MHTISSYHGNRPTNRQGRLQCTAPQLARNVTMLVVAVMLTPTNRQPLLRGRGSSLTDMDLMLSVCVDSRSV